MFLINKLGSNFSIAVALQSLNFMLKENLSNGNDELYRQGVILKDFPCLFIVAHLLDALPFQVALLQLLQQAGIGSSRTVQDRMDNVRPQEDFGKMET